MSAELTSNQNSAIMDCRDSACYQTGSKEPQVVSNSDGPPSRVGGEPIMPPRKYRLNDRAAGVVFSDHGQGIPGRKFRVECQTMRPKAWAIPKGVLCILFATSICWPQARKHPSPPLPRADPTGKQSAASDVSKGLSDETSHELVQQAGLLIEKQQFSGAIVLLQQAERLAPSAAQVHHYLGYALWKDGQTSTAASEFEKALKLDPSNVYAHYFLGRIAYSQGSTDRAIKHYEAIVASGSPIYDVLQRLGQAYFRRGDGRKALDAIQQVIRQTPWDGALHYQLAKIYQQTGRAKEAEKEFATAARLKRADQASIQKLLQLSDATRNRETDQVIAIRQQLLDDPAKDMDTLIWLGTLLGHGGYYKESLEPLEIAVSRAPNSFEAQYNLGLTLAKLGRDSEAETSLRKALALDPGSFEVNSVLAYLYVNQNRHQDSIERLQAANQARPGNLKVLALLGQQYLQGRYLNEAIATLREAVRLDPNDSKIRYLLIEAYQKDQDYEEALSGAQDALRLFPHEARAHFEVGQQLANLGKYQEGRPYFEEAIQLHPSFTEACDALGDAQSRNGEYEAALASFQRALQLDPQNLLALRGAGHSLIYLKRYHEALQEVEEAIKIHPGDSELYFELSQVEARMGNREKAAEATATFQRLHAEESRKQDAERKRSFMPEARGPTEEN